MHHRLATALFVLLGLAFISLAGCGDGGGSAGEVGPSIDDPLIDPSHASGAGPSGGLPADGGMASPTPGQPGGPPGEGSPAAPPAGTSSQVPVGPTRLTALEKRYTGKGPVVSREGIKLKLITTKADCPIYAMPDKSSKSSNVGIWQFFFVIPPDPEAPTRLLDSLEEKYGGYQTANHFYRVAYPRDENHEAGWLYAEDVVEWHHRQVLRLTLRETRKLPAHFWADREKAIGAAEFGGGPPDDADAVAREPDEGEVDLLLPLLQRDQVRIGRDEQDLYRVAFIGAPASRTAAPSSTTPAGGRAPPRTRKEARETATVDIVFVIDTTSSMSHAITQVRQSVAAASQIVASLPELKDRLRFGLVGYRDTTVDNPDIEYAARVMCTLEQGRDHQHFANVLARLETTSTSSQGYPEDVLCGLAHALTQSEMRWNPASSSLITLVGDSSAKGLDHPDSTQRTNESWPIGLTGRTVPQEDRTIGTLLGIAQPGIDAVRKSGRAQIGFLTILVDHSGSTEGKLREYLESDRTFAKSQYQALAAGRASGVEGKLLVVEGGDNPHDFSRHLAALMEQQLQQMRQLLLNTGPVQLPAGATAASAPVGFLQLLRSLPGGGDGEFKFARGYCTQLNNKGEEQFDPYYLVHLKALKKFLGGLNAFLEILETSDRDASQVVEGLQLISSMLAYDQPIDKDTKLRDILESELGLPVRNDVFRYTPSMLRSLPQGEFDGWLAEVKRVRDGLAVVADNPNKWHALERDSGYGFVAVKELP